MSQETLQDSAILDTEMEPNIAVDAKLNRFALELEAERQASLVAIWGTKLADAKKDRDGKALELKILTAQKGTHFRETLAKATVAAVDDAVISDLEVQAASKLLNEAEYQVSLLYAAVNAIDQKKGMIETLSKLYLSNYYSKPNDMPNSGTNLNASLNAKD